MKTPAKPPKTKTWDSHAVGRRKMSVARVYASAGSGLMTINNRSLQDYFPLASNRYVIHQPLKLLQMLDKYDMKINVKGGGITGQAGAIRLGIGRALLKLNPNARPELKKAGFLTRDSRKVERKKPGRPGARKRFQFSKR